MVAQPAKLETAEVIKSLKSLSLFGAYDSGRGMWRREMPSPFGDRRAPIVVYEDPNRASIGGEFFLWPASLVLCEYIFRNPSLVRGRKVLELGSSHGLAALAASAAGARRVLATDQEEVVSFLASNVAENPELSVEVAALEWGVGVDAWGQQHGWEWDVVIGSDLTFNRDSFLLLLSTLQQLLCRNDASRDTAENPCRALLLHDDDSVPGGKYMRNEFFNKAAVPYFHVTRADLRTADMSEKLAAAANDFDSSTVHGYWLALRADAPNVPAVACAESLQRLHRARLEDSERNKDTWDGATQKKRMGVTISEMMEFFRPANLEGDSAPKPHVNVPKPHSPAAHARDSEDKRCADSNDAKDPGKLGAEALNAGATMARANKGSSGETRLESQASALRAENPKSCAPAGKTGTSCVSEQVEGDQAPAEKPKIKSTGAHWWDADLGEYEPLEFTEEMLRGVDEGKTRIIDPQSPASWDDFVKEEAASGMWRNITVDTSQLPNLADDYEGGEEEEDDDEEELEVVDLDALRAAAWDRTGMEMPSSAPSAPAPHATQARPAPKPASAPASYRAPAKPPGQAKPPACFKFSSSTPEPHKKGGHPKAAHAAADGKPSQVRAQECASSSQERMRAGAEESVSCTPPPPASTPVALSSGVGATDGAPFALASITPSGQAAFQLSQSCAADFDGAVPAAVRGDDDFDLDDLD